MWKSEIYKVKGYKVWKEGMSFFRTVAGSEQIKVRWIKINTNIKENVKDFKVEKGKIAFCFPKVYLLAFTFCLFDFVFVLQVTLCFINEDFDHVYI